MIITGGTKIKPATLLRSLEGTFLRIKLINTFSKQWQEFYIDSGKYFIVTKVTDFSLWYRHSESKPFPWNGEIEEPMEHGTAITLCDFYQPKKKHTISSRLETL